MLNDIVTVFAENPAIFTITALLLGLLVGSFLNVVIHRLPRMMERDWREQAQQLLEQPAAAPNAPAAAASAPAVPPTVPPSPNPSPSNPPPDPASPPSACPHCGARIKPWHNIPVLSWLMLRGRCAGCAASISIRYPVVELATGLLSAIVAWHFGFTVACACALWLTWCLIALTGIDLDHQLLPDTITLPLLWSGLIAAMAFGASAARPLPVSPTDAIAGAAAGYLSLWLVFHAFRLATGKEGMGYGDFKLYAALGAWLGWKMLPAIILLSAASGAVLGIAMILLRGRDRSAPMPFGPYLAAAGWLTLLYGDDLVTGYLRVSGLPH